LADLGRLETETKTGRGWIACELNDVFYYCPCVLILPRPL